MENSELSEYQKLVIGCCFLFFALVALLMAVENWRTTFQAFQDSQLVEGTVMANSNLPHQVGDHGVAPLLWFRTPEGKEFIVQSKEFTNFPFWQVGDLVTIRYQKHNPQEAVIDSFLHLWLYPLVSTLFGILFGAAAIVFLWKVDRKSLESEFSSPQI